MHNTITHAQHHLRLPHNSDKLKPADEATICKVWDGMGYAFAGSVESPCDTFSKELTASGGIPFIPSHHGRHMEFIAACLSATEAVGRCHDKPDFATALAQRFSGKPSTKGISNEKPTWLSGMGTATPHDAMGLCADLESGRGSPTFTGNYSDKVFGEMSKATACAGIVTAIPPQLMH